MFPVEEKIPAIAAALRDNRDVVLTAPPGSGKTTCVPPALLDEPWLAGKKIVMLEPRRLAARNCAAYVAHKLGEPLGGLVGYQVRLERKISARTRLEIVTEGLLTQRLLSDPELHDVGLVIFDEFHERSLACDLSFALALEVRRALRPDLRLLVMSATLDADEVAAHLADGAERPPQIVRAEGRCFPVETRYLGEMSMAAAVGKALAETKGDILCFLPGEGEIRRTLERLKGCKGEDALAASSNPHDAASCCGQTVPGLFLPLYGSLPKEEQDRVFAPSARRKVILATSIAETSLTIEGITTVIDSGLMRVPRFSPATGMTGLVTLPLTRDRAEQRRGRAGRVCAGVCYRLWSEASESSHPARAMPEILDADLASLVLTSAAWGALRREDLPWMTPPPASAWERAVQLLTMLGALDARGALTAKGRALAALPMHPRLATMCLGGERVETAALLAAIIEEGGKSRETDIRRVLDLVRETPHAPYSRRVLQLARKFRAISMLAESPWSVKGARFLNQCQTEDGLATMRGAAIRPKDGLATMRGAAIRPKDDLATMRGAAICPEVGLATVRGAAVCSEGALLALAYPDRIAKNRGNGSFRMVSGRGAFLEDGDALAKTPYLVCCALDDRAGDAKIFLGCPIDEAEILSLFGDRLVEEPYCAWDRPNDRVKCVLRRRLGQMTLSEVPVTAGSDAFRAAEESVVAALMDGIRQKGVENLPCWTKETRQLRARLAFLSRALPEAGWPAPDDAALLALLPGFLSGMTKGRDLERLDIAAVLDTLLASAGHDRRALDRLAPTRMEVPSGSNMTIHYEGTEPTVEVRLQECFGLMETPKVAGGRVPIVMTLLSPAQRPVQVTKDLAGFWTGAYQLVRKDMRGRYPKHYWPEDPLTAVATRRVRPKTV